MVIIKEFLYLHSSKNVPPATAPAPTPTTTPNFALKVY